MGILIGVGIFAGFIILVAIDTGAMLRESEKRVAEWARSQAFVFDVTFFRGTVRKSVPKKGRNPLSSEVGQKSQEGLASAEWRRREGTGEVVHAVTKRPARAGPVDISIAIDDRAEPFGANFASFDLFENTAH